MTPIIALTLSGLGLLGGCLVALVKIVRKLSAFEQKLDQAVHLTQFVPQLWSDVDAIKRHLDISTPRLPMFTDDQSHDAEE